LPERLLLDELLELGDQPRVLAQLEFRLNALLQGAEAQLHQSPSGSAGKRFLSKLRQREPAPKAQRLAQQRGPAPRIGLVPRALDQGLEAPEVVVVAFHPQPVAGSTSLDLPSAERLPQLGHVDLEGLLRAGRR